MASALRAEGHALITHAPVGNQPTIGYSPPGAPHMHEVLDTMNSPDGQLVASLRHAAEEQLNGRSLRDIDTLLNQLVAAAVDMIPGATGGGISRTEAGTVRSTHATSQVIYDLDEAQSTHAQGPCISCLLYTSDAADE